MNAAPPTCLCPGGATTGKTCTKNPPDSCSECTCPAPIHYYTTYSMKISTGSHGSGFPGYITHGSDCSLGIQLFATPDTIAPDGTSAYDSNRCQIQPVGQTKTANDVVKGGDVVQLLTVGKASHWSSYVTDNTVNNWSEGQGGIIWQPQIQGITGVLQQGVPCLLSNVVVKQSCPDSRQGDQMVINSLGGGSDVIQFIFLNPSGGVDTVPSLTYCSTDKDCPTGQTCNQNTNLCQGVPGYCTQDSDCPAGQQCNKAKNTCEPIPGYCVIDSDCPTGFICDVAHHTCVPAPAKKCTTDTDCPTGFSCDTAQHLCVRIPNYCNSDKDCWTPKYKCNMGTHQCVPVNPATSKSLTWLWWLLGGIAGFVLVLLLVFKLRKAPRPKVAR